MQGNLGIRIVDDFPGTEFPDRQYHRWHGFEIENFLECYFGCNDLLLVQQLLRMAGFH